MILLHVIQLYILLVRAFLAPNSDLNKNGDYIGSLGEGRYVYVCGIGGGGGGEQQKRVLFLFISLAVLFDFLNYMYV